MVDEAARSDCIVTAHCYGKVGIMVALRAGCKMIEQGTYLDEECVSLMREKGAMLIATRTLFESGLQVPEVWTPELYAKLKTAATMHEAAHRLPV